MSESTVTEKIDLALANHADAKSALADIREARVGQLELLSLIRSAVASDWAIVFGSLDGVVTACNREAVGLFGGAITGRPIVDLIYHDEDREAHIAAFEAGVAECEPKYLANWNSYDARHRNGSKIEIEIRTLFYPGANGFAGESMAIIRRAS